MGRRGGLGAPLFLLLWGILPEGGSFGGIIYRLSADQREWQIFEESIFLGKLIKSQKWGENPPVTGQLDRDDVVWCCYQHNTQVFVVSSQHFRPFKKPEHTRW